MKRLEGKTAIVTGGARGIGRAIAIELAREGARVAINYHSNDAKAQEVAAEIAKLGGAAMLVKADVSNSEEAHRMVKHVAEEFRHVDILVNNAGITRDAMLKKMTDENWLDVIQTNLNAYFYCTSAVLPFMTAQSYGRIVNVTSLNGQIAATGQANYSAAKGGVISFTRTAAMELARCGITVNSVAPGYTETDMFAGYRAKFRRKSKRKFRWGVSRSRRKSPRPWCSWWPRETTSRESKSTLTVERS